MASARPRAPLREPLGHARCLRREFFARMKGGVVPGRLRVISAASEGTNSMTRPILEIRDLAKVYEGGFTALHSVSLDIAEGEIFALLGPNGAGKTTLISSVCGIVTPTSGTILVDGHDNGRPTTMPRAVLSGWCRRNSRPTPSRPSGTRSASRAVCSARALAGAHHQGPADLSLIDKTRQHHPAIVWRHEAARPYREGAQP
jgi:hypothetical protein